jgi:hypothetical protein
MTLLDPTIATALPTSKPAGVRFYQGQASMEQQVEGVGIIEIRSDFITPEDKTRWADERALLRDESAVGMLITLLDDQDDGVVAAAADALGHIGESASRAWDRVSLLLADTRKPKWLRDTCAYALGQLGVREPRVERILRAVAMEGGSVARCAREALRALGYA